MEKEIERNIRLTIRRIKQQGTCGMSIPNLLQITPTPKVVPTPKQVVDYPLVFARIAKKICERTKFELTS